jgi:hypothetical protein
MMAMIGMSRRRQDDSRLICVNTPMIPDGTMCAMPLARSRVLACLAFVSMLLLVVMPIAGRSFGSGFSLPGEGMHSAHEAAPMSDMASMSHEEHMRHMAHMAAATHHKPAPKTPHDGHAGHDCAYCPLLSALHHAASVSAVLTGPAPLAPWSVRVIAAPPVEAPVPALGAQGPPAVKRG